MIKTITGSFSNYKMVAEACKSLAQATGKPVSPGRNPDGSWGIVTKVTHKPDTREFEGNTSENRHSGDETENDFVARSYQQEADFEDCELDTNLSSKLNRVRFPKKIKHELETQSFERAKTVAKSNNGSIKKVGASWVVTWVSWQAVGA